MTTHTPAPWTVGEDNDVFACNQSACVALVTGAPEGINKSVANARLIASAPELLEVAQLVDRYGAGDGVELHDLIDAALKAIQKATGE